MDRWDVWLHVAEVIIAIVLVPSIRALISILTTLNLSVAVLSEQMRQHRDSFERHVEEDRSHFKQLDGSVLEVSGWFRELKGMLTGWMTPSPRP